MAARIKLEGDAISYPGWEVPLSEVRVIGEFLNQHGRGREDYFLVFMTREEWFKAPYLAEGREGFMAELGQKLGHELRCDLFNSTNLSSRVLWPAHLEGKLLFDLTPEARATGIVTRVRQMLMQKVQMRFTEEVRRELGRMEV